MTDTDNPWQKQAACRDANPELFFHPEGERGPVRRKRDADALAICSVCPVIAACREDALTSRVAYGVWGGLTEGDREEIWKRRGKTAKTAAAIPAPSEAPAPAPRLVTTTPAAGYRKPPVTRIAPEVEQMVRLLHRRGFSGRKISKLCQVSQPTVRRILGTDTRRTRTEQVAS